MREEIHPSWKCPADFPLWLIGQGKSTCSPDTHHYRGNRDDHDWLSPIKTHPQTPGARGYAPEHICWGEERQCLTARLFTTSQCMTSGVPTRRGVGFLRAGVLSPHQSEIPGHQCLFQTRNPGRTGAVFPPRIPIKIHGLLTNIHSVYLL